MTFLEVVLFLHFLSHAFEFAEVGFVGASKWKVVEENNLARKLVGFKLNFAFAEIEWLAGINDDLATGGVVFGHTIIGNDKGIGGKFEFLVGTFDDIAFFDKF